MELEFTIHLLFTIVALLVTLLILLKGTRNFVYRSLGLVSFAILLVSISIGYMDLIGKPKPLTYEQWTQRESNEQSESGSDGEESGTEEAEGENEGDGVKGAAGDGESGSAEAGGSMLTMDVLQWEENIDANEAYLWLREIEEGDADADAEVGPPEYYSFQTDTEDGKELLKQLREADQKARRMGRARGRPGHGSSGIQLNIIIDKLWLAPKNRFKFSVPPKKQLMEKEVPEQGIQYGTTSPTPNRPGGGGPR